MPRTQKEVGSLQQGGYEVVKEENRGQANNLKFLNLNPD